MNSLNYKCPVRDIFMVSVRHNIIELFSLPLVRDDEVVPSVLSDTLAIIRPLATTSSNLSYSCFNLNDNRCEKIFYPRK